MELKEKSRLGNDKLFDSKDVTMIGELSPWKRRARGPRGKLIQNHISALPQGEKNGLRRDKTCLCQPDYSRFLTGSIQ
jgi:hypothetical protein